MNSMDAEPNTDSGPRPKQGGRTGTRLIKPPRPGQRLSASGMVGGLLPGMILGLVVGLLTGSFIVAAIVGLVAVVAGGLIGARLAKDEAVDVENPAVF